jgi:hypothetical protein
VFDLVVILAMGQIVIRIVIVIVLARQKKIAVVSVLVVILAMGQTVIRIVMVIVLVVLLSKPIIMIMIMMIWVVIPVRSSAIRMSLQHGSLIVMMKMIIAHAKKMMRVVMTVWECVMAAMALQYTIKIMIVMDWEMMCLKNTVQGMSPLAGLITVMMKMIIATQIFTIVRAYVTVMQLLIHIGMTRMKMD